MSFSENSSTSTRRGNERPRPNIRELLRILIPLALYYFLMLRIWIMGSSDSSQVV
jgi:hypothetical protein